MGEITVNPGEVKPVDFMLSPSDLSQRYNFHRDGRNQYDINNTSVTVTKSALYGGKDYISTWARVKGLDGVSTDVTVNADDTRAFMIDEGIRDDDTEIKPFRYIGTITLNNSKNVGIDVQGTHTDYSSGTNYGMNDIKKSSKYKSY